MQLFVSYENIRATLCRQNLRLTAASPETAFRLRRLDLTQSFRSIQGTLLC
jgi:hypothetical protein